MASPENDTVMFALILLGAVAVMLAVALLQRLREIHRLRELGERVQAVAESGDLAERLTPHAGEGSAGEIAAMISRSAYAQLRFNPALLVLTLAGLALVFGLPLALLLGAPLEEGQ